MAPAITAHPTPRLISIQVTVWSVAESGEKRGQQVRSKQREGGEAGNIDVYTIEVHGRSVGRNASQVK
jgi:hypothetical protein